MNWQQQIEVITFDLDDTLWAIRPILENAEHKAYEWINLNAPQITEKYSATELMILRRDMFLGEPSYANQISKVRIDSVYRAAINSGINPERAKALANQSFDIFMEHRNSVRFYEGAVSALEQLAKHYILGAITNGNADIFGTEAGQLFSFSVNAEEVNSSKPDSKIFEAAYIKAKASCKTLNTPNQVLHIGDDEEKDVEGAIDYGFNAIKISSIKTSEKKKPCKSRAIMELTSASLLPNFLLPTV